MVKKQCFKCKVIKNISEFSAVNKNKDGKYCRCKKCDNQAKKESKIKKAKREKIYREKNREAINKHKKEYKNANFIKNCVSKAKERAYRLGLEFDLNDEFILNLINKQNGKCFWLGIPFLLVRRRDPQQPSIDRLDNSKGYTRDNVVVSCLAANYARNNSTTERFKEFISLLKESIKNE